MLIDQKAHGYGLPPLLSYLFFVKWFRNQYQPCTQPFLLQALREARQREAKGKKHLLSR